MRINRYQSTARPLLSNRRNSMKKLLIFDLSNFIFRAFFAIRPLHTSDGTPVNAVYGVMNMLISALEELHPTHLFIAQDHKGGSFRNKIYKDYKANRGEPPEDLVPQFALIEELVDKFEMPKLRVKGFEADDLIGSAALQFKDDFDEILIASSDKDLMQFVDDKIKVVDTMRNKIYGRKEVIEKMGVPPEQIRDYLSLVGDTSDNVPGVKGIGAKGAAKLLTEYKDLETIFENVSKITNKRVLNGLTNHKEDAFLSKELVTINCDVDLNFVKDELEYELNPTVELKNFLTELNFKSAIKKLYEKAEILKSNKEANALNLAPTPDQGISQGYPYNRDTVVEFVATQHEAFLKGLNAKQTVAIAFDEGWWSFTTNNVSYVVREDEVSTETTLKTLLKKEVKLLAFSPKSIIKKAWDLGLDYTDDIIDIPMAHFNIDPDKKNTEKFLVENVLNMELSKEDVRENTQKKSRALWELWLRFEPQLKELEVSNIYYETDLKLNPILAEMEYVGIKVDKKVLTKLEKEFSERLDEIEKEIQKITKMDDVNLKSPKQVGEMLFEKLGLPVIKKTKTGFSTDHSVLTKLEAMDESPVPGLILQYREIDKLLSTYVGTLPDLVNPETDRIHTNFNQMGAATGRLSSDNPNLQNIPIKSENGRRIRKAFIADKGFKLLAADYSQVELRILAHFCEDPVMMKAFQNGEDIHAQTASEVFGVPLKEMTSEIRSKAKAINFGLIYGQSSFGLSETLNISRGEAKEYIEQYFLRFSKVKAFLDSLKEKCEKTGYAETLMGRRRPIPDIRSKNRTMKSFAERMAINSPIQGTAADIIKLAMMKISEKIDESFKESRMILQVHDELIFEAHESELEDLRKLVVKEMESAVKLKVPLKVDVEVGDNWYEL